MTKIYINFVSRLKTGGFLEATRSIEIDCDQPVVNAALIQAEIAQRFGIELKDVNIVDIYRSYPRHARPEGATAHMRSPEGTLDMEKLKVNNPLNKFSVSIPLAIFNQLDDILEAPPILRLPAQKKTTIHLTFIFSDKSDHAAKRFEQQSALIDIDGEVETISSKELLSLLEKNLVAHSENFHIVDSQLAREPIRSGQQRFTLKLADQNAVYSIKDLQRKKIDEERIVIAVRSKDLFDRIGPLLEHRRAPEAAPQPDAAAELDRRSWIDRLELAELFPERVERNGGMERFVPAPASPDKPAKKVISRTKDAFDDQLGKLKKLIDNSNHPLFPGRVLREVEKIYKALNTEINNNVTFSSLSEDEITDYFRLVELLDNAVTDFPEAAKARMVAGAEGDEAIAEIPSDDPYNTKLVEMNSVAKRISGCRSVGKMIGGLVLAFISVVALGLIWTSNLLSCGVLTIPNLLPTYLSLGLFATGMNLAIASGLGLALTGLGLGVAVDGRRKGISEAVTKLPNIVREERKGHREAHATSVQYMSKLRLQGN
jgi:hypothetical protein